MAGMEQEPAALILNESPLIVAEPTLNHALSEAEPYSSEETPANSVETHHHKGKRWGIPFTKENSAEMARRGLAAKKQREAEEQEQKRKSAEEICANETEYRLFRLRRTREQLSRLDKDLEAASDEKGKKTICDAIKALCDVEQRLAMRPLPGSHRPSKPTTPRPSSIEPSE